MTDSKKKERYSIVQSRTIDWKMALIAKRTYALVPDARCRLHEKQEPLVMEPEFDDQNMLVHDSDAVVLKEKTDVVVKGAAHPPGNIAVTQLNVGIDIAGHSKRARVTGDRVCYLKNDRLSFSSPKGFTAMPLDYTLAYGGSDELERKRLDDLKLADVQPYTPYDLSSVNLCIYPRNSVGKGYALGRDSRLNEMALPNIEDLDDLLTPENLVVSDPRKWYRQPAPAGFDYYDYNWFPRTAHAGAGLGLHAIPEDALHHVHEIRRGYLTESELFPKESKLPFGLNMTDRFLNAASPGLCLDYLRGDEEIRLENMDPAFSDFVFHLPDDRPTMKLRPLDENQVELTPSLYTVLIEKEENRISLVWGGVVTPRLPHGPEQCKKVEYEISWRL